MFIQAMSQLINKIVIILFLSFFLRLVLPDDKFEPYLKMVTGLVIILVMLNPLLEMLDLVPDLEGKMRGAGVFTTGEPGGMGLQGLESSRSLALGEYQRLLEEEVRELAARHWEGGILSAVVSLGQDREGDDFGHIRYIELTLSPSPPGPKPPAGPGEEPWEPVGRIQIQGGRGGGDAGGQPGSGGGEPESPGKFKEGKTRIVQELKDRFRLGERQVVVIIQE